MSVIKTVATTNSVKDYIAALSDEQKRKDSLVLLKILQKASGKKPVLWSHGVIGFGTKMYRNHKGSESPWYPLGFSPRKTALSIHIVEGFGKYKTELKLLGKHKLGAGCLNINSLKDIDVKILEKIINSACKSI